MPLLTGSSAQSGSSLVGDRSGSSGRRSRSAAIQGLRAVAVVAVVADHLLHKPSGGFVGVDVFFVISGYLITGLLIREVDRTGRIDLIAFYKRRVKRTLPLAVAVVLATVLAGSLLFPAYRFKQLTDAAAASTTFSINWQLIAQGADYLHATDAPTPLQHFWSLAVEEQFYLVWPAALIALLVLARRLPVSFRVAVVIVASSAVATSLVFCFWQTRTAPTAAYFSTFGRAWELGLGALLAAAAPVVARVPPRLRSASAWTGTAGIVLAAVLIDPNSPFPAPWALLPVLSTALVVIASEGDGEPRILPLTNRLSQYVGDLSYSAYLWHFPVIVFMSEMAAQSKASHAAQVVLIAAISVLSFHLLETPLRQASWRRGLRRAGSRHQGLRLRRPRGVVIAATVAVLVSSVAVPVLGSSASGASALGDGTGAGSERPVTRLSAIWTAPTDSASETSTREEVALSASIKAWPAAVRSDVAAGTDHLPEIWTRSGCLWLQHDQQSPLEKTARCSTGAPSARRTAVLFGDSIALSYYPALRRALDPAIWRIRILTAEQCPAWRMTVVRDDKSAYPECDSYRSTALKEIAGSRPDLVVTASSYSALWRAVPPPGSSAVAAWSNGAAATLRALTRSAGRVLVLDAPQMSPALRDCLTPVATPATCSGVVDPSYADAYLGETSTIEALQASNVVHPTVPAWYCTREGICPPVVAGNEVLADGMHPSESDADRIALAIRGALQD